VNGRVLAGGIGGAAAAATAVVLYDPFATHAVGCPFHAATGLYCPGCGSTRAAWLLLHGDLAGAVAHNLLFLPAVAYLVARWLHAVVPAATGWLPGFVRRPTDVRPTAMWALALALVVFAVARNLPGGGFLAPPAVAGL
jgi:hypothetical protein